MTDYRRLLGISGKNLDRFFYEGNLGALYTPERTEFRIWSPIALSVKLCLYKTGSDSEAGAGVIGTYNMVKDGATGVWSYTSEGDMNGVYYTYRINHECIGERETADIYSRAVGVNGNRSMVVDLSKTNPDNWESDKSVLFDRPTDAIIWEVQVRDFS